MLSAFDEPQNLVGSLTRPKGMHRPRRTRIAQPVKVGPGAPAFHRLWVRSGKGKRVERFSHRDSYAYQLDALVAAVLCGEPVNTTREDAVENMTVIDAIYHAAGLPLRKPS